MGVCTKERKGVTAEARRATPLIHWEAKAGDRSMKDVGVVFGQCPGG